MTVQITKLGHGTFTPDASWDGMELWFDNANGIVEIELPAANTLPAGTRFRLYKQHPNSNHIHVRPTTPGTRLNHFWTNTDSFGLHMNLTQQIAEVTCDGVLDYVMCDLSHHHGIPQSQRSLVTPTFNMTPLSINEILLCNTTQAGGGIWIPINPVKDFSPYSPVTNGNYHSWVFWAQKVDNGPAWATLGGATGEFINPNNDVEKTGLNRGYVHLTKQWDTAMFLITAGGVHLTSLTRKADLP